MNKFNIDEYKIMETIIGSNLYGTNTPTSDEDFAGIFIAPASYLFGLKDIKELDLSLISKNELGKNTADAVDRKFYELRRFMNLAYKNNPNITELLFIPNKFLEFDTDYYKLIRGNAYSFLSKNFIYDAFMGYANSQRHKMIIKKEHYEGLFAAQEYFKNNETEEYFVEFARNRTVPFLSENKKHFMIGDLQFQKHLLMRKVKTMIDERLGRITNRVELVLAHGYDTKFASHLIRLLYEGVELLRTGKIVFPLTYADILLDIKNGKYKLSEIMEMAENLEDEMRTAKENSELPEKASFKFVNQLTINLIKMFYDYN